VVAAAPSDFDRVSRVAVLCFDIEIKRRCVIVQSAVGGSYL